MLLTVNCSQIAALLWWEFGAWSWTVWTINAPVLQVYFLPAVLPIWILYQSIWSHYLKLFLGHAAYAQTLVLAIFMGGMAVGSLVSGFFIHRWRRLLIGYAVVEAVIGVLALVFHPVFISVTDFTFGELLSGRGDTPVMVMAIKWGVASLLIFPQSVLLGMTFLFLLALSYL